MPSASGVVMRMTSQTKAASSRASAICTFCRVLPRLAARRQFAPPFMQPVLTPPRDFLDLPAVGFGNVFLALAELGADFGRQPVVLGTFIEDPAQMPVATFGDRSLTPAAPAAGRPDFD